MKQEQYCYLPKVGDYVVGRKQVGWKYDHDHSGDGNYERTKTPIFKKVYGEVKQVGGELYIQGKRNIHRLENFLTVKLVTKKEREDRWERETRIEATFDATKNLPWNLKLAKRFNTRFTKDFKLEKSRIKIVSKLKGRRIGQHDYTNSKIEILTSLTDLQRWETYFHELAHYREHGHDKQFHEEMEMIYRRFNIWATKKNLLVAAKETK